MKYVIVIEDGASDYPIEEIDGKTPLKIADKPVLDKIAREGKTGLIQNVPETLPPGSDVANMSIFGYDPLEYYTGRGPLEAASMGVDTKEGDVVFRCNTIKYGCRDKRRGCCIPLQYHYRKGWIDGKLKCRTHLF